MEEKIFWMCTQEKAGVFPRVGRAIFLNSSGYYRKSHSVHVEIFISTFGAAWSYYFGAPTGAKKKTPPSVELDIWEWLHFWSQNGSNFVLCAGFHVYRNATWKSNTMHPKKPERNATYTNNLG